MARIPTPPRDDDPPAPEPADAPESKLDDKAAESFNPMAVVKRMGAKPGLFILVGFLVTHFKDELKEADGGTLAPWLDLLAGGLFVIGILWWLVRVFEKIFSKRPARGLIDGLSAGILAGVIGGLLGYGWPDLADYPATPVEGIFTVDSSPRWVRTLLAFIFCVPIAGTLGVGLDLVHTDRKIAWRKKLGIVVLVVCLFLLLIWTGIFVYVPGVTSMGIRFSDILALFDWFLILYSSLVFVSFGWQRHKIVSRLLLILAGILTLRIVTYLIPTQDETSAFGAEVLNHPSWPNTTSYWWRTYWIDDTASSADLNNSALMGLTVVLLCLWSFLLYAFCHANHRLTTGMDTRTRQWLKKLQS